MPGVEQPIQHFLTEPSHTQVISRLQKFDETDLARQVAIMRGTFYAKVARSAVSSSAECKAHAPRTLSPETEQAGIVSTRGAADCSIQSPLTKDQLLASADAIAEEIHTHAIKEGSGSV